MFKEATIWQKILLGIFLAGLAALALYQFKVIKIPSRVVDCSKDSDSQTIKVSISSKFDPSEVDAHQCDKIIFTAIDNIGHWPAVGPHPTHSSYPGFDALHDLKEGESFTVSLNKTGTYSIHDHSHPEIVGTVNIDTKE